MIEPSVLIGKLARVIVGLIYIFSGLLKLLDPVGMGILIETYFKFAELNIPVLDAQIVGVVLGSLEIATGLAAVLSIRQSIVSKLIIWMQSCFTVISLILVIFNPNMHCGCFGEALHLSHRQTLVKNVFMLALVYIGCFRFKGDRREGISHIVTFGVSIILMFLFAIYSWFNLPIVDFTVYKPGTEIVSRQTLPMLRMKGTNSYPDFSDGRWAIVSVYDLYIDMSEWRIIADQFVRNESMGYNVILLFSATEGTVNNVYKDLRKETDVTDEVLSKMRSLSFLTDKSTAITLNRRNSGITYINDGVIVKKKKIF